MTTAATDAQVAVPNGEELAGLVRGFHEAAEKLKATHETLSGEVRRLQGELAKANEELERSRRLAALGEMAAGIAHEVRNPLGSITLYARMLEEDLGELPEQQETATKIRSAVRGLDAVVTDVLHFSKEISPRCDEVDLEDVVERVVSSSKGWLGGIEVVTKVVGSAWIDPDLIHRALVNLVRNAADAMDAMDRRHAWLRVVSKVDPTGTLLKLRVDDTGPGIPPEVRERMFNPFFTTRAVGTGLGLSIVHRIAEAHGGRVEVRNRPGQGSDPGGASVALVLPIPTNQTRSSGQETAA